MVLKVVLKGAQFAQFSSIEIDLESSWGGENTGGSFWGMIITMTVWGYDVLNPPFLVPPSSWAIIFNATLSFTLGARGKRRVPNFFSSNTTRGDSVKKLRRLDVSSPMTLT